MALIGQLAVNLTARTKRFERGMQRSRQQVSSFSRGLGSARAALLRFAGVMGVALGGAVVVAGLKRQADAIDSATKLAQTLDMTTEQLTGYQHAASLAGVSTQGLERGLARMTRMEPGKTLEEIADEMKALPDASARAARGNEIFGRRWQEMMPLLMGGSEGLKQARQEVKLLGMSFDKEGGQKVEAMNDAFTRLKGSITGLLRDTVVRIAPAMKWLANQITKGVIVLGEIRTRLLDKVFSGDVIVGIGKWARDVGRTIVQTVKGWVEAFGAFEAGGGIRRMLANIAQGFVWVGERVHEVVDRIRLMGGTLAMVVARAGRARLVIRGDVDLKDASNEVDHLRYQYDVLGQRIAHAYSRGRGAQRRELEARQDSVYLEMEAAKARRDRLRADLRMIRLGGDTQAEADARASLSADGLAKKREELWGGLRKRLEEFGEQGGTGFVNDAIAAIEGKLALFDELGKDAASSYFDPFRFELDGLMDGFDDAADQMRRTVRGLTPGAVERGTAEAFTIGARGQAMARERRSLEGGAKAVESAGVEAGESIKESAQTGARSFQEINDEMTRNMESQTERFRKTMEGMAETRGIQAQRLEGINESMAEAERESDARFEAQVRRQDELKRMREEAAKQAKASDKIRQEQRGELRTLVSIFQAASAAGGI